MKLSSFCLAPRDPSHYFEIQNNFRWIPEFVAEGLRLQQRTSSTFKMSSRFAIQKPHIIATLPQPIDRKNGRYVVGEVVSGRVGTKKRKRSELAVGIDGEGLNLYDVRKPSALENFI